MNTKTTTTAKPKTSDGSGNCWPPMAHRFDYTNGPPKEGDLARCGAKLMGIDLRGMATQKICPKCEKIQQFG